MSILFDETKFTIPLQDIRKTVNSLSGLYEVSKLYLDFKKSLDPYSSAEMLVC